MYKTLYSNLEVLISQDPTQTGLDPDIYNWSQTIIRQYSWVRYQSNSTNLGLAGNWNAVAAAAQGEYIVIIGDDDILLPNFVEILIKAAQPESQVIFANHYIINEKGDRLVEESIQWTKTYHRDHMPSGQIPTPEAWIWQNSIPMISALVRTATIQRLQFKEDLNSPEIELFLRLAKEGGEFVFVPEYLAEYRVHCQSATGSGRGLRLDRLAHYLLSLPAQPVAEIYKYSFLSKIMSNAVSQCLLDGRKVQAQAWLNSPYYPRQPRFWLHKLIQQFCISLPGNVGIYLYQKLYAVKKYSGNF